MNDNVKSPQSGPAGMVLVTGDKADDANVLNRSYLDSIRAEMRVIDAIEPTPKAVIFGEESDLPIMMPVFLHLNRVLKDGKKPMLEYARAAKKLNTVSWVGMGPNEEYAEVAAEGARTVRIIKPFADHNTILDETQSAIKHDAIAVDVDIDHVPDTDGRYGVVDGILPGSVMFSDLKEHVKATGSVPFVAKGVLSVQDALKCKEAGCAAIIISHHHGRIPFGVAPVMVLPKTKAVLEGSGIAIFVDCGTDTGYDAYKALALGVDAVAVGRGTLKPLLQQGTEGVEKKVQKMNEQLSELMTYTCVKDTRSSDVSVLYV